MPILPAHAQSLGADLSLVGAIIASYAIAQLLLRIPIGLWADARGKRKFLVIGGLVLVTVGALGLGSAPNTWLLFLARAITGGGAATWVVFTVLFASYYPKEQTGRAISIISFVNGIALVTATASGGVIAQIWGTQSTFFGAALLGVAALVTVLPVKEPLASRPQQISLSTLLNVASQPLLLVVSLMSILVHFTTFAGIFGFIPVYAARIGASSTDLGIVTMLALASAPIAALGVMYISERWGYSVTIRIGAIVLTLAFLAVPFVQWVPLLAAVQVANGVGRGLLNTTLMALSIRTVAPERRATAMGVYQSIYAIGMILGPLTSGFLANGLGLSSVFYVSAILCLIPVGMASLPTIRRA